MGYRPQGCKRLDMTERLTPIFCSFQHIKLTHILLGYTQQTKLNEVFNGFSPIVTWHFLFHLPTFANICTQLIFAY